MAENQVLNDVCAALLEECAREMGVTLEGIAKSSHRKALRDVVEGVARQKLAVALERAVPTSRVNQQMASAQNCYNNVQSDGSFGGSRLCE